jgi:hypothetical protein
MVASTKTYRISRGDKNSAVCRNKEVTWERICTVLGKHKVAKTKEQEGWFCGGGFSGGYRNTENLLGRSLLTIDVDECAMSKGEIEFELEMTGFALVAYSTWRSTDNANRFRIVLPLSREVSAEEYVAVMHWFASEFSSFIIDDSAFKPAQFMYMPSVSAGSIESAFVMVMEGSEVDVEVALAFPVEKLVQGTVKEYLTTEFDVDDTDDDADDMQGLSLALAHEPIDVSDALVEANLDALVEAAGDYSTWITVGQALHHQYRGSDEGKLLWLHWSANSDKFNAADIDRKWQSFKTEKKVRPLTFATVIKMVKDSGVSVGEIVEKQVKEIFVTGSEGLSVDNDRAYEDVRNKLRKLPLSAVTLTKRQQIAQDIYDRWGKGEGMTKSAIVRELCPPKKGGLVVEEMPSWLNNWVYVQRPMEFHNLKHGYSIKREAFNAEFDRMDECVAAERSASSMALVDWKMDTVIDTMYWASKNDGIFVNDNDGLRYVNSYKKRGVLPCEVMDDDGLRVVDMMLKHLEFTLVEPKERAILLDWMCHVVQNIGSKVNWAVLLQGTQGGGKTYFTRILQGILGSNATQLDPKQFTKGTFSGWAYGSVLNIVEEIRLSGDNRWSIIDTMKPYITNETIQIEEKFSNSRTVPNFTSYFLLTNYQDALPITNGDRRYCVLYSRCQSEEHLFALLGGEQETNRYFEKLFSETDRRMDALCHYFMNRVISADFSAKGRAPKTLSREKMIGYSVSHEFEEVKDLIAHYHCEVINENIVDITLLGKLNFEEFEPSVLKLPKTSALTRILLQIGYEKVHKRIDVPTSDGGRKKHTIWRRSTFDENEAIKKVKEYYKI